MKAGAGRNPPRPFAFSIDAQFTQHFEVFRICGLVRIDGFNCDLADRVPGFRFVGDGCALLGKEKIGAHGVQEIVRGPIAVMPIDEDVKFGGRFGGGYEVL